MGCHNGVVDDLLKRFFYWLGYQIGKKPGYFIIVPLLLTALCVTGFQQLDYEFEPEYLFSPTHGLAKHERAIQEEHFPTNYSEFMSSRISRVGKFARVVVVPKDGGTMLRTALWNQLLYVDQIIYNVSISSSPPPPPSDSSETSTASTSSVGGHPLTYEDLCARRNDYCYDNEILRLSDLIPAVEVGEINLTYPIYFDPFTFESYPLPAFFGGVELSEINTVRGVKAVALAYFLDVSEEWQILAGDNWERQFLRDLQELGDIYAPDLEIGMFVSNTPAWEMEKSRLSINHILIFNVIVMVIFSLIASLMSDAARSKPLIGFFGLLSAALATISGFGFCCYVGVEFISLNMAAPFLLLGIGIDDTFVLLSSWRRTSVHATVPERMGRCFSDAAVSITVTSITDFLSFMAGYMTPFPCVRIFCVYSGVSVAFIYVWHVTLFAAGMAIAGYAEESNRHGLFCVKVTPKSRAANRNWLYRLFLTGGLNPADPHNPKDNREHVGMVFFRDPFASLLSKSWVKGLVLVLYLGYLVMGGWGLTMIEEGLEKRNTANYDSYSVKFYDLEDLYFKEYSYTINVVVSGEHVDFSSLDVQNRIEIVMQELENSTYIDGTLSQSWLRDFLDYVDRNIGYDDINLDVSTEASFARTLREDYLSDPSSSLRLDVEYEEHEDGTRVKAARFIIYGHNVKTSYMEQRMLEELRDVCSRHSGNGLQFSVFHPWFIYIDQYLAILPQTIQCVLVTAAVMVVIALIFIPNYICAFWVSFSIVSIELGVVGYMTWWGVRLDGVALINLIMCIGFSVDFSAHICYHYMAEEDANSPTDRIRASLYALGIPILQGAGSTILGVFGLAFAPSYMFVTFFKMIFLVILLGMLHGVVLLPVLLSLFGPGSCSPASASKASKSGSSVRSSGLSTPTTLPATKYTVNLGFVPEITDTPTSRSSADSAFHSQHNVSARPRHHHHHHHHHHHRHLRSSQPAGHQGRAEFHVSEAKLGYRSRSSESEFSAKEFVSQMPMSLMVETSYLAHYSPHNSLRGGEAMEITEAPKLPKASASTRALVQTSTPIQQQNETAPPPAPVGPPKKKAKKPSPSSSGPAAGKAGGDPKKQKAAAKSLQRQLSSPHSPAASTSTSSSSEGQAVRPTAKKKHPDGEGAAKAGNVRDSTAIPDDPSHPSLRRYHSVGSYHVFTNEAGYTSEESLEHSREAAGAAAHADKKDKRRS